MAAGQCHPGQEEGDDKNAMEEEGTQCVRLYDHLVYIYIYLNKFLYLWNVSIVEY